MDFKFAHNNINVLNLERSIDFYQQALGLKEVRRKVAEDGSFILVFMGDGGATAHLLELTWLRDRTDPYNLGENEMHIAFEAADFERAYALHKEMGCICYENKKMGIYFINDPDGYWLEVVPKKLQL
ncbi:MAG: VOC family protein [Oscillospiraceae bacterium]|nr:VOC family protein [Oscillospiraceae bacterium]